MLQIWLRYASLFAYLFAVVISRPNPLNLPVSFIAAGVTMVSMLESQIIHYVFHWTMYSLLVYMLITYHEHDACLLDKCDQSETSTLITIIATITAWAVVPDKSVSKKAPKKAPVEKPKEVALKLPIKPVPEPTVKKEPTFPKLQWV